MYRQNIFPPIKNLLAQFISIPASSPVGLTVFIPRYTSALMLHKEVLRWLFHGFFSTTWTTCIQQLFVLTAWPPIGTGQLESLKLGKENLAESEKLSRPLAIYIDEKELTTVQELHQRYSSSRQAQLFSNIPHVIAELRLLPILLTKLPFLANSSVL